MSKQANPTLIGAFVLGAVVLAVAGVLIFGGGELFKEKIAAVTFFDGSVQGLDVGAPVRFRGVQVGAVSDIYAKYDPATEEVYIPVYLDLVPESIRMPEGGRISRDPHGGLRKTIEERGLKAQLRMDSLITGKYFVALDFFPEEEMRLVGADETVPEIPTAQTGMQKLRKKLSELPIEDLLAGAVEAFEEIRTILSSPELKRILQSLDKTSAELAELLKDVRGDVKPLAGSTEETLAEARKALKSLNSLLDEDIRRLVRDVDVQVEPLSLSAQGTLTEARKALAATGGVVSERSELRINVSRLVEELAGAARSVRLLAAYLERHPEALIQGKEN
jgi:paraquat-inducible protein B